MKKKNQNYFIQDAVLINSDEDFFRHKDLSKNIANVINNDNYKTPYNIALIGKWGLGKSSLLKFIEPQISKKCEVFTINAWKYEKESLKKKFLKSICEEITKKKISSFDNFLNLISKILKKQQVKPIPLKETIEIFLKKFGKFLICLFVISLIYSFITANLYLLSKHADYAEVFSGGFRDVIFKGGNYYFENLSANFLLPLLVTIIGLYLTSILDKVKTPINIQLPISDADDYEIILIAEIDALLQKKKKDKVVVIIDDLDRLSTTKIVEALETLKSLMEIKNCIFIVPFDDTLIKNALEKKVISQVDSEHQTIKSELILDKLFQFKFYMPPLIKSDIKDYTIDMIKREAPDFVSLFTINEVSYFDEIIKKTIIYNGLETPRQIKKIVNVLSNNLLILNERCKYKVTENSLLNRDGLHLLSKLSVLQADFNDFYDTLYIDNSNIENLLNIHEKPIIWDDIPYELKFLFEGKNKINKGMSKIKKENEMLVNFLSQTRSVDSKNIRAYLYLNQDKLSVKYGSEFNTRITNAIESANIKTSAELINESKNDLNELLIEVLEDTQPENINNTIISLCGIIDLIKNIDNRLLELLSEKTADLYKVSKKISNIEMLQIENIMYIYTSINYNKRNGMESLLSEFLDTAFRNGKQTKDKLANIINIVFKSENIFTNKLKEKFLSVIRYTIIDIKVIDINYFVEKINLISDDQYIYYLGIDFYKMLCSSISENGSFTENQTKWLILSVDSLMINEDNKDIVFEELSELYSEQSNIKILNNLVFKYRGDNNE